MARNKQIAEVARSVHRASERLWVRVADSGKYNIAPTDVENLQKASTQLNRAITKLKRKAKSE